MAICGRFQVERWRVTKLTESLDQHDHYDGSSQSVPIWSENGRADCEFSDGDLTLGEPPM